MDQERQQAISQQHCKLSGHKTRIRKRVNHIQNAADVSAQLCIAYGHASLPQYKADKPMHPKTRQKQCAQQYDFFEHVGRYEEI